MLKECMGIINLDENEDRIRELTRNRILASMPMGGRYRIIDFILSNMTNAGIANVGIFTKMNSRSLMDHLKDGSPWDLNRKIEGIRVFNFNDADTNTEDIFNFGNNIEYLYKSRQEYVVISSSYMICNIDFREVLKFHKNAHNDITIVYKSVNDAEKNFSGCEILNIDENNRVVSVGKNVGNKKKAHICMEMYIMKKQLFIDIIDKCITLGIYKKFKKYIYNSLNKYKVGSYEFNGYLSCVNSLKSYYNANMDLFNQDINKELFSSKRPIYTKTSDEVPARYINGSSVKNSIIGNGCEISGTVENSIIFRRVKISKDVILKNCIIFQNCVIGQGTKLSNVITDKYVVIDDNKELKGDEDTPLVVIKEKKFN